jgi:hypothetical protein
MVSTNYWVSRSLYFWNDPARAQGRCLRWTLGFESDSYGEPRIYATANRLVPFGRPKIHLHASRRRRGTVHQGPGTFLKVRALGILRRRMLTRCAARFLRSASSLQDCPGILHNYICYYGRLASSPASTTTEFSRKRPWIRETWTLQTFRRSTRLVIMGLVVSSNGAHGFPRADEPFRLFFNFILCEFMHLSVDRRVNRVGF